MLWRKMKQNGEGSAGLGVTVLNTVVRGGLTEKVTFEQRPEEGEGGSKPGGGLGSRVPRSKNSICKAGGQAPGLFEKQQEASVPGVAGTRGEEVPCLVPTVWAYHENGLQGHTHTLRPPCTCQEALGNGPQTAAQPLHALA